MGRPPALQQPACFTDVVEAQQWAQKVLQKTEDEANRRGCRGSRAWEDAWRDSLWTLALQKRCVEVEARKCRAAATADQVRSADAATASAAKPLQGDGSCFAASIDALCQTVASFERRCVEPVHKRLDDIEDRLARLLSAIQVIRAARATASAGAIGVARVEASVPTARGIRTAGASCNGTASAGPLPTDVDLSAKMRLLQHQQRQQQQQQQQQPVPYHTCNGSDLHLALTELQQQLMQVAARADSEAVKRGESERECQAAGQQLQELEMQAEAARRQLSSSELNAEEELRQLETRAEEAQLQLGCSERRAGEEVRLAEAQAEAMRQQFTRAEQQAEGERHRREESEGLWQQRLAALQRQLRRTEVALGEAAVFGLRSGKGRGARTNEEVNESSPDVAAVLQLWREFRSQRGSTSGSLAITAALE